MPRYAAVHKPILASQQEKDSGPLKQALIEIERSFQVSIAYKDEWIENKFVYFSSAAFKVPEQALDNAFERYCLYYEKAGERILCYSQENSRGAGVPQSSAGRNTSCLPQPGRRFYQQLVMKLHRSVQLSCRLQLQ
jgi:hypothetical protein